MGAEESKISKQDELRAHTRTDTFTEFRGLVDVANDMIVSLLPADKKKLHSGLGSSSSESETSSMRSNVPSQTQSGASAAKASRDGRKKHRYYERSDVIRDLKRKQVDTPIFFVVNPGAENAFPIPLLWKLYVKVDVYRPEIDDMTSDIRTLNYRQFCRLFERMLEVIGSSALDNQKSKAKSSESSSSSSSSKSSDPKTKKVLPSSASVTAVAASGKPRTDDQTTKTPNETPGIPLSCSFDVDKDDDNSCPICLDRSVSVVLTCGHQFCESCVSEWISISSTCPLCRATDDDDFWTLTSVPSDRELVAYLLQFMDSMIKGD